MAGYRVNFTFTVTCLAPLLIFPHSTDVCCMITFFIAHRTTVPIWYIVFRQYQPHPLTFIFNKGLLLTVMSSAMKFLVTVQESASFVQVKNIPLCCWLELKYMYHKLWITRVDTRYIIQYTESSSRFSTFFQLHWAIIRLITSLILNKYLINFRSKVST